MAEDSKTDNKTAAKTRNVFGSLVPFDNVGSKTPASVPKAKFKQAIWQSFGNMSALARLLGVNYTSLRSYFKDHKDLADLMEEARSRLIDQAEEYIASCLSDEGLDRRSKIDLAKFILKTQGKSRGWTEGPQIQQQINVASDNVDLKQIFGL